ncbi:putative ABC-class ATPase [Desulfitispora alkaliphila]|uniref:ABC-ATPase domain-containing protein n=1 Tax=Desulfitispora alkaliphila TaxID=622674 RepID=UPI003D1D29BD
MNQLIKKINTMDNQSYSRYKDLTGKFNFPNFSLYLDYIQGDPFATPTKIRARVEQVNAGFKTDLFDTQYKRIALEDFLTRQVHKAIKKIAKGIRGTGKSGIIEIDSGGQEILNRTAVVVNSDYIEARLTIGLPARGRRVLARVALEMLTDELPKIISSSIYYKAIDATKLSEFIKLSEDQYTLRKELKRLGLVTFVANGSILPRESGISNRPLQSENLVPFKTPEELQVEINLPNRGKVVGMGLPAGISLIVGGGYHGKSTLLQAIERGVYNHILGDGRELVATEESAAKIRAEDGRYVSNVDISSFINNLPFGQNTVEFFSADASGSTSQAANINEALECGSKLLLIDEDTSATNFMIRDKRMQELVSKDKEPITPFIDKARQLWKENGVSTILVVGGVGDYFDVADNVIMLHEYSVTDVTEQAKKISEKYRDARKKEGGDSFGHIKERTPIFPKVLDSSKLKIDAKGKNSIQINKTNISLSHVEQLADPSQTRAIGFIINYALKNYSSLGLSLNQLIDKVLADIDAKGLDVISIFKGGHPGQLALPRKHEIATAFNRWRELKFTKTK